MFFLKANKCLKCNSILDIKRPSFRQLLSYEIISTRDEDISSWLTLTLNDQSVAENRLAVIAHFPYEMLISLQPSHSNLSLVRAELFALPDGFGVLLPLLWSPLDVSGWSFSGPSSGLHSGCILNAEKSSARHAALAIFLPGHEFCIRV